MRTERGRSGRGASLPERLKLGLGQQLKTAAAYLREHQVDDCWMAYTASGVVEESYYGVRCRPLPTAVNLWWIKVPMEVPKEVEGTVLISDDELEGVDLPAGQRSPYADFKQLKPDAVLDGGIFVYRGRFDLSAAAALADANSSLRHGRRQK